MIAKCTKVVKISVLWTDMANLNNIPLRILFCVIKSSSILKATIFGMVKNEFWHLANLLKKLSLVKKVRLWEIRTLKS